MSNYEFFYNGSGSPLNPEYSSDNLFMGYRSRFKDLSIATDPRTANQIKEVSEHLNTGIKNVEVSAINANTFQAIPKQQFEDLKTLSKLTGAELSFHGPMVEPTGIGQNFRGGYGFSEMEKENNKRTMWDTIEKVHTANSKGAPVIFHATVVGFPGAELKYKNEKGEPVLKSILAIGPNGEVVPIENPENLFPRDSEDIVGQKIKFDPQKEIRIKNKDFWTQNIAQVSYYAHRGEELIDHIERFKKENGLNQIEDFLKSKNWENQKELAPEISEKINLLKSVEREKSQGRIYLDDSYRSLRELYELAYKNANNDQKNVLDNYAKKAYNFLDTFNKREAMTYEDINQYAEFIREGIDTLEKLNKNSKNPLTYLVPLKDFAIKKSADTFSDLALESYKKFKNESPIIAIENHPAYQSILTRAEEIKGVVKEAREQFVEKAVKEGISKKDATKAAEKLIGATWDVGHINMLRKYGYEKKDIIKESEIIAPYVKHVHLSDNFGLEHTELPMGMGNVPIKEIMEKLGKEGFEGKKIIEAGDWWQHFSQGSKQNHPLAPTLQAFGSPLYSMEMQPYWNQVQGSMGSYFGSPMAYLPEKHFDIYGSGFSNLPTDLGGQSQGDKSRMSGTPLA